MTKKLEDFELFGPNLIEGLAFDFGFTFRGNNRAIQKANKEALQQSVVENFKSIEFIKEGPDCEFVLFGSKPAHDEIIRQGLEKEEEDEFSKNKTILITVVGIGLFFLTFILINDLSFDGAFGLFFQLSMYMLMSSIFIIRKKVGSKKGISSKKLDRYKRAQLIRAESLQLAVFVIPVALVVVYLFQYNVNFRIADWAVQCTYGNELQLRSIFTASFVQTSEFMLALSVLVAGYVSALFLINKKPLQLFLVFIISGVSGYLIYNIVGTDLSFGAELGIVGVFGAMFISYLNPGKRDVLISVIFWGVLTALWVTGLLYFDEWRDYIHFIASFWTGIFLGIAFPNKETGLDQINPLTESNEEAN